MNFINSWGDQLRAASYAKLEFPNTYYLAYRDLPAILAKHVSGDQALDFGCGTGRSTRFLKKLGFRVTGIDIAADMIRIAEEMDPGGHYELVKDGEYAHLGLKQYDLVQCIFTFDNIPGWEKRTGILKGLSDLLQPRGTMICLDSTPELYVNESASFTTQDFPENRTAKTGDIVRCIMRDVEDRRPVEDIFWAEEDYDRLFKQAGLATEAVYKPLGMDNEGIEWKCEKEIAPWMIFVLKCKALPK